MDEAKLAERVRQLEESQAFAERTVEQVSAEVGEMQRKIVELARRVARLEAAGSTPPDGGEGDEGAASGEE